MFEDILIFPERECSDLINGLVGDLTREGSENFLQQNLYLSSSNVVQENLYLGSSDVLDENIKTEFVDAESTIVSNFEKKKDEEFEGNVTSNCERKRDSTRTVPSTEEWPGPYNFEIKLGVNQGRKWEYSEELKKVFINMNAVLPVEFRSDFIGPSFIRVLPVYSSFEDRHEAVRRCPNHAHPLEKTNTGFEYKDHIVRCQHKDCVYDEDPENGRLSVVMPLDNPQPGTNCVTGLFTFMCMNSCTLGINRRSMSIIFTHEMENGEVIGRRTLDIKVCSVVHRDKEKEERTQCRVKHRKQQHTTQPNSGKRLRVSATDTEVFADNKVFKLEIVGLSRYRKCAALLHDHIVGEALREGYDLSDRELQMVDELKNASKLDA